MTNKKEIKYRTFKDHKGKIEEFTVFLIHGHSKEWEKVEKFIIEKLGFRTIVSVNQFQGGIILQKIKNTVWHECDCAVAILSPDDKLANGESNARQNVIYEIGYCQGFWDYYYWEDEDLEPVIILKEHSVELNSDLNGIEFIEYESENIQAIYKKLTQALENIFNYLDESGNKKKVISPKNDSKEMANDLKILKSYLLDRKIAFISFDKLISDVHPRFTEDYMMKLIEKFPTDLRKAKLNTGRRGIKILN